MSGLILLPTFSRPQKLKQFINSYIDCHWSASVLVLVDKQDPKLQQYLELTYPSTITLVLTEGRTMAAKCQAPAVWDQFIDLDWVGILNDDHVVRTVKGDLRAISQINGTNIIGTNDLWQAPNRLAGLTLWSTKIIKTLGYLFIPGTEHLFIDSVFEIIGNRAKCVQIVMDVTVEHVHALKTGDKDETHNLAYGTEVAPGQWDTQTGFWKTDKPAFDKWLKEQMEADCQKVVDLQPKQGLQLATPFHDNTCSVDYAVGMTDLALFASQNGIYFEMARVSGSSLIPHARNSLVDMFLKSKCQRMLFIDADQGFDRNVVIPLLQSNKRIVAGVTPHKRYPLNLNFEPLPDDAHFFKDLNNKSFEEFKAYAQAKASPQGEIEVNRTGTGCVMIDRSVFDVLADTTKVYMPFDGRTDVTHREYFWMGGHEGRFRGEDWFFMSSAKAAKIPIYINVNSLLTHQGQHNFRVG